MLRPSFLRRFSRPRFRLTGAFLLVQMVLAALVLAHHGFLLDWDLEARLHARLDILKPVLDVSLREDLISTKQKAIQDILSRLVTAPQAGIVFIVIRDEEGHLIGHAGPVNPATPPLPSRSLTGGVYVVEQDLAVHNEKIVTALIGLSTRMTPLSDGIRPGPWLGVIVFFFFLLVVINVAFFHFLRRSMSGSISTSFGHDEGKNSSPENQNSAAEEKAFLKTLLQTIPQMIWLKDPDGVYLSCNKKFETFIGKSEKEIVGLTDYDLLDRDLADFFRAHDRIAMAAGKPTTNEEWLTYAVGGHRVLLRTTKTPMHDEAGTLIGVVGVAYDITEIRHTEEALRRSQETLEEAQRVAGIGSWELDIPSGQLDWSDQTRRIFDMPADTPVTLDLFFSRLVPEDRPVVQAAWKAALAGAAYDIEHRIVTGQGTRWVRERAEIKRQATGEPSRGIGTTQDITNRKTAEIKLLVTIDALTRSNTELERFAYIASHDLQEPLRSIVSFTQLIQHRMGDTLPAEHQESFAFVIAAAKRMSLLIQDLLSVSRVAAKGMAFVPVALGASCQAALTNLRESILESGAEIEVGDLPLVMGDAIQLMQVFQNLIGNAIKFRAKDRPPVIRVAARQGSGAWRISIADNGLGMGPTDQDIFEMFRRLHPANAYPGTGIGLTVCKRIITRHGGTIWMESEEGKGSTFHFTLPNADASPGDPAP
ncbi:ATP-binding protein [Pararhodospirillum oryzae]|uniref:histidine kinase n=1 Tax=Pararhodospirillum oryzae TaxID=478448 RepID=A0A512HAW4_9PROT|nr:ATP-binding protein [Pararhodospirillum oryzae]GEO82584.1 hypothetical protein ROR02_27150 [Pararhodospirillum oryzae]